MGDNFTGYRAIDAEGARVGLVTCLVCASAILIDPADNFDAKELHRTVCKPKEGDPNIDEKTYPELECLKCGYQYIGNPGVEYRAGAPCPAECGNGGLVGVLQLKVRLLTRAEQDKRGGD